MSWLRPGVQVPLATACSFAGLTLIVVRILNVDVLGGAVGDAGAVLTGVVSFFALRALVRTSDPFRARLRAIAWPPLLGAVLGASIDILMHVRDPDAALSFCGVHLYEMGLAEYLAVALMSAGVGVVGTIMIAPQVFLLAHERSRGDAARVDRFAQGLAASAWMLAALCASVAFTLARSHVGTTLLLSVTSVGLAAQLASRLQRTATHVRAAEPYRGGETS
jgi:hypothetical protein